MTAGPALSFTGGILVVAIVAALFAGRWWGRWSDREDLRLEREAVDFDRTRLQASIEHHHRVLRMRPLGWDRHPSSKASGADGVYDYLEDAGPAPLPLRLLKEN